MSAHNWPAAIRARTDRSLEPVTRLPKANVVAAAAPQPRAASSNANDVTANLDNGLKLDGRARAIPHAGADLFTQLNWQPPPPPPAPPSPPAPPPKPPEPKAPPLPFSFIGMLERGTAKPEAFLAKADALLVVSVGDLLDNNTYRIDSLSANEVVMTYLPLNIQQTLLAAGATK